MQRTRGFTLLEMLVVVFIIGVVASFSVIYITGRALDDKLDQEAQRLTALLRLAADNAVVEGTEVGFLTDERSYAFLILDPERGWLTPPDDTPLRTRELPTGMTLTVRVDDFALPGDEDEEDEDARERKKKKDEQPTPQIYFLSSEELSPFELELSAEGTETRYRILGKETGEIELANPETLGQDAKSPAKSRERR